MSHRYLLTRDRKRALASRPDLLSHEARHVADRRITWAGRAAELSGYGRAGGSAMDRRLVVEAMAAIESGTA